MMDTACKWLASIINNFNLGQVPVAHNNNPSNLGGRDQKDRGLKPAWANSSRATLSRKKPKKKKKKFLT
jgi:hypothetical protein